MPDIDTYFPPDVVTELDPSIMDLKPNIEYTFSNINLKLALEYVCTGQSVSFHVKLLESPNFNFCASSDYRI